MKSPFIVVPFAVAACLTVSTAHAQQSSTPLATQGEPERPLHDVAGRVGLAGIGIDALYVPSRYVAVGLYLRQQKKWELTHSAGTAVGAQLEFRAPWIVSPWIGIGPGYMSLTRWSGSGSSETSTTGGVFTFPVDIGVEFRSRHFFAGVLTTWSRVQPLLGFRIGGSF